MLTDKEDRLLILLAADDKDSKRIEVAFKQNQIDWNYLLKKVAQNRIFPQLHRHLMLNQKSVPKNILDDAKHNHYMFSTRNMIYFEELGSVMKALQDRGIRYVPIRGVALAETIYSNKHDRYMSDIDLLLPNNSEVYTAIQTVEELGYSRISRRWGGMLGRMLDIGAYTVHKHRGRIAINLELKSFITNWFPFLRDDVLESNIWRTSRPTTIEGIRSLNMNAENMLIVLCSHSFDKRCYTLRDLSDMLQILYKTPDLNWSYVLGYARRKAWRYILCIPFNCASLALKGSFRENLIPKDILDEIDKAEFCRTLLKQLVQHPSFPINYDSLCHNNQECKYTPFFFVKAQNTTINKQEHKKLFQIIVRNLQEQYLILKFAENPKSITRLVVSRLGNKLLTMSKKIAQQFNL